jgi:hypothetical protein
MVQDALDCVSNIRSLVKIGHDNRNKR